MKKLAITAFMFACCSLGTIAQDTHTAQNSHILWYDKPAATWTEALPIANSRLGAMIFGAPSAERLQLNEETIWAGRPNNNANPEAKEYLPKVRDLVWKGKYKEHKTWPQHMCRLKQTVACLTSLLAIYTSIFPV